jgi:ESCRT-I complex subunit TSG101
VDDFLDGDSARVPSTNTPAGPAPVRPPNPELISLHMGLHQKLQQRIGGMQASMAHQNQQMQILGSDLDRGEAAIHDEIARLEAVKDVCRVRAERLDAFMNEARATLKVMEEKAESELDAPGVGDDWVCATSIVGDQ